MRYWNSIVIALLLFFVLFLTPFTSQAQTATPAATLTPTLEPLSPPLETPDWRYGIVESYEAPAQASAAGVAWTRLRFQWANVQPTSAEEWNAPLSEQKLAQELTAGREVVGLLIGIPEWAKDDNGLPLGLYLEPNDPENLWAGFVREAVTRYEGQITHWVIWNEPDIWEKEAPGHTWDGTVEDFYQLLKVAYITAKTADPQVVIHLSAFTYFWDEQYGREQYMARLLDLMIADPTAPAYNYYFDVATAHLYFQPAVIYDVVTAFRQMMLSRHIHKPIWLVETNAPPHDDPAWPVPNYTFLISQNEQATFMGQALAVALAAGAERIAIYKMKDLESDRQANPEPFGLIRRDNSRRPAYQAFQIATRYLANVQQAERKQWDTVGWVHLQQLGQTTDVLFARLPAGQQIKVPAAGERALLVDMWGNRRTIQPVDGFYVVDLRGALCSQTAGDYCMIGGEPVYLVQRVEETVLATATPTFPALPTITPTPSRTPTPTVTSTPTPTTTFTPSATPTQTPSITPSPMPSPTAGAAVESQPTGGTSTPSPLAYLLLGSGGVLLLGVIIWAIRRSK